MTGSPGGISIKTSTPSAMASNGLSKASANGGGDTAAGGNTPSKSAPKRVEVDTLMTEFQAHLGPNWDRYRDVITHFLTGKFVFFFVFQQQEGSIDTWQWIMLTWM